MKIIALDPGGSTGIASTIMNERMADFGGFGCQQLEHDPHHTDLYRYLTIEAPNIVVCERFIHQNRRAGNSASGVGSIDLVACEYIGVARLYCDMTDRDFVLQTPSQAKGLWSDEKLKAIGMWLPGKPHAMDATRHLLYFITVTLGITDYVELARARGIE